jgi:hypothetical protein
VRLRPDLRRGGRIRGRGGGADESRGGWVAVAPGADANGMVFADGWAAAGERLVVGGERGMAHEFTDCDVRASLAARRISDAQIGRWRPFASPGGRQNDRQG